MYIIEFYIRKFCIELMINSKTNFFNVQYDIVLEFLSYIIMFIYSHIMITCFDNLLWHAIFHILKQIIVIYKYLKLSKIFKVCSQIYIFILFFFFFFLSFEHLKYFGANSNIYRSIDVFEFVIEDCSMHHLMQVEL